MSLKKILSSMLILGVMAVPAIQMGCVPNDLNLIPNDQIDDTDPADQTPPPAGSQTPVLTITSLVNDITVAQGQPVLLTWQIQNLPTTPTIDVLCRATTEDTDKLLIAGLTTSNVGSLQIDTFSLVPGLKYYIKLNLKSAGAVVASAQTGGRVTIGAPKLTITSPLNDKVMLPSELMTINWTGNYLPAGSTLQTFLDSDTTYSNGNEIIVKTDSLPAGGSLGSGSISLDAMTLWNHADVKRSVPYYLGLRIVKNGQISIASYASATVKLYGGEGFDLTSPGTDQPIRVGDSVNVKWTTVGVPKNLNVKIFLTDRGTGQEIVMPGTFKVTSGGTTLDTLSLSVNHSYDIIVKLLENDTVIAVRQARGVIITTTEGSSIYINNSELTQVGNFVFLGLENTYTITWETIDTPVNSKVVLLLDEDGNEETTTDQFEVTPSGGVDATLKAFDFTPSEAQFDTTATGKKYYVIVKLVSNDADLYAQDSSEGTIRIGAGGIAFDKPATDVNRRMGDTTDITWITTGDICTKFAGKQKTIRLYVDENSSYLAGRSQEITPIGGLDTCAVQTFTFDPSTLATPLTGGTKYYVIARLTVEGETEDETRVVAVGQISVDQVSLTVTAPTVNVTDNFDNIPVAWETAGLNTTGKKVVFVAIDAQGTEIGEISAEYAADANAGTLDASKLPPGTYTIRGEVFGITGNGSPVELATGDAPGQIIRPDGYNGVYLLSDMAAITETGYSPVDGTIFEGFLTEDSAGYAVAGMGDLNDDDMDDFFVFSKYGKSDQHQNNQTGAGYLIYGRDQFGPILNLKDVGSTTEARIDGVKVFLPWENVGTGEFKVTPLPDISGDGGKKDLMITCSQASPLHVVFVNKDPENTATVLFDGMSISVGANRTSTSYVHRMEESVSITVTFEGNLPDETARAVYKIDYEPGDEITFTIEPEYDTSEHPKIVDHTIDISVASQGTLASCYLLTSQRLTLDKYNVPGPGFVSYFDMNKVGYSEADGLSGTARDHMIVTQVSGEAFGVSITPIPDLNFDNSLELMITNPDAEVTDFADPLIPTRAGAGFGHLFQGQWRSGNGTRQIGYYEPVEGLTLDGSTTKIDFIGNEDDAHLTSASALGKVIVDNAGITRIVHNDFNDLLIDSWDIVIGTAGSGSVAGAVYILPVSTYNTKAPLIDLYDVNRSIDPNGWENPINGIKITGVAGDNLGKSVHAIGDFNGDLLPDFVIAMPDKASSGGAVSAGRIMIVFGKHGVRNTEMSVNDVISGEVAADKLNALIFEGTTANGKVGSSVCHVDANNDGCDDLLVTAPGTGKIYLIYGRTLKPVAGHKTFVQGGKTSVDYNQNGQADTIWSIETVGTSTLPGAVFVCETIGTELPTIASAGDVNNDGFEDFLIGDPNVDTQSGGTKAGKAYLILGRQFTWPVNP